MIAVLLTILKILGIAILAILGVLLCVLLLVLFVPVRYGSNGSYLDNSIKAEAHASWLLHAVLVKAEYCKGQAFHIYLKLFGIPVYDNLKTNNRKKKNKKIKSTKNKPERMGEIQAASVDDISDIQNEQILENDTVNYEFLTDNEIGGIEFEEEQEPKGNIFQKIKLFFCNFVRFFKNIKFTFQKLCDTIIKVKDNIKYYTDLLRLDTTKQAFSICKKQLVRIIKRTAPKKYRVNLHLGFGDPAAMGEVLAVWGMFYPIHQGNIRIEPEFETSVMEGDFSFKGRISVYVFLWTAYILYFDRDIRLLVKRFKHNI